jgi:hypothetical protein
MHMRHADVYVDMQMYDCHAHACVDMHDNSKA